MIFKEAYLDNIAVGFLRKQIKCLFSLKKANAFLQDTCGIIQFFNDSRELEEFKRSLENWVSMIKEPNRREYGDFQTNDHLANLVTRYLLQNGSNPTFVLEPTCGKGNFLIASIRSFKSIRKLTGIEIYEPYIWETKFKILSFYIQNSIKVKPEIRIIRANVFDFSFDELAEQTRTLETLIIGNPPWVTNAELGSINSKNLPEKSNFKMHRGFDAITGKGNFDIGEYISLLVLKNFHQHNGYFGFLLKNSVVKNIIYDQRKNRYKIGSIEKLNIDSKKEFGVSVNACLFLSKLNSESQLTCQELDLYTLQQRTVFGWCNKKFVYSILNYNAAIDIEGKSQFVWRQGIKHDCSKIMEIKRFNDHYLNGFNEEVHLENDLLYGLIKSSDLKEGETNTYRKLVIVTQTRIGQDTNYINQYYPLTFRYLNKNKIFFEKRKSSIYKGKPDFSIFGVGQYSFAPYKVAISGFYKRTRFTLVFPDNDKPIMLDDTCYFIGFDNLAFAKIAHFLLNSDPAQQFLRSIIFPDSKRPITKDILMRIDFHKIYTQMDFNTIRGSLPEISQKKWSSFGVLIGKKTATEQMTLF